MGEQRVLAGRRPEELRRFMKQVLADLRALERMLEEGWIETDARRIGAEQELFLVHRTWEPAPLALEILDLLQDPHFTTELGRFNLEFNLDPLPLGGDVLSRLEERLEEHLHQARAAAHRCDAEVVLTGILPTLRLGDLTLKNMTPRPRYRALNEAMAALRGGAFEFYLQGLDELIIKHENVMLEACNTSFQVHLQVTPDEFARRYNLAQAVAGPVLAAATNSPLLFGKRLWRETRIGLFQQAVDTRTAGFQVQERLARVSFGQNWVRESILEIFRDDIARFRAVLGLASEEDPFAELAAGRPPRLLALCLHNSTVYRWNRPCYGVLAGRPHLRIENRYLPAGPSVADEVANAAFWLGLMEELFHTHGDITAHLSFEDAKNNFLAAAREGLAAQFTWLDGAPVPAQELILLHLLPAAHAGLLRAGITQTDADHYLRILEKRVTSGLTGSTWLLKNYARLREQGKVGDALAALVAETVKNQVARRPVHEWPSARLVTGVGRYTLHQRVELVMTTDVFSVHEDEVIDLVASVMDWQHIRHVPVEDDQGRLVGLVSYRNLIRLLARSVPTGGHVSVPVHQIMERNVVTIHPEARVVDAIRLMRRHRVSCLPVVKNDRLVGIVTEHDFLDLAAHLLEERLQGENP